MRLIFRGLLVCALWVPFAAMAVDSRSGAEERPGRSNPPEVVILLHGLARSHHSMSRMETALQAAGYRVISMDYPSTQKTVQQIAENEWIAMLQQAQALHPAKIHFVAHSMGNIILRQYFAHHTLTNAGRMVMLGPPNQGSEVVDKLGALTLFEWINGPAGRQLGTASNALPNLLPIPPVEVGVIAGTLSINWFLSCLIPGPDDGKVAVERTRLAGMEDFAKVAEAHPFLMQNPQVIDMTLHFIKTGRFAPEKSKKIHGDQIDQGGGGCQPTGDSQGDAQSGPGQGGTAKLDQRAEGHQQQGADSRPTQGQFERGGDPCIHPQAEGHCGPGAP